MQFKLLIKITLLVFLGSMAIGSNAAIENKVRLAISSSPANLSPFYGTDGNSQNINRLVHLTLTDFSKKMTFYCRFCETFSERMEGAKHILSFKLKKNINFWDGSKVTAKDVYNSWKYFTDTKVIKSVFRFGLGKIKDVKIINDYNVELVYEKFDPDNLSDLALLKIVKINKKDIVANIPYSSIIGAGPYKYKIVDELEVTLESRDGKRPELVFKVVKDETTLALKLINKEIDLSLANISPRKYHWLKNNRPDLSFHEMEGTIFNYMGINHKNKYLKIKKIRKALSLLIPREKLLKHKLKSTATPSSSMFSKAFTKMYIGPKIDSYDPDLSEKLFKESGFSKDKKGKLVIDGKPFKLTWRVSNNKNAIEMVETIKKYFERAGIEVEVSVQEWGIYYRNIKQGKFDIMMGRWMGFTGPSMLKYVFHSESVPPKGANRGYFVNKEFDKLIDLATTETNEEKRNNYYKKALEISNEEYSYINLWHPNIIWIGRKCLQGVDVQPNGSFLPLLNLVDNCGK
ncbi:hypothetical protein A9Q84_21155 [Halobacteriovorax marinus]|uniref:Solute-binding protein family 5 domain-containing protein n=1 Tax=Halobacteriovorax marinus TaxID=97084 RepID=A0A1Y5F1K4_9BACT|nr:hypothetical protein A9Q84_21155 [Halobacteriovorax marinus]